MENPCAIARAVVLVCAGVFVCWERDRKESSLSQTPLSYPLFAR